MNQQKSPRIIIELERVETWPTDLLAYLSTHYEVFLRWEADQDRPDAATYDEAVYGLIDVLQPYALVGWHCTRLTGHETAKIIAEGMELPNAEMLTRRIEAATDQGLLSAIVAERIKAKNQAHEPNRAGMIWFCFFPPSVGGEHGIGDLLRFWGGEALYNSHDQHPENSQALRAVGTPSIIEAEIPIAFLGRNAGLAFKIVRRYLIHRGYETREPCDHEDRIRQVLPATCVRRIHPFPEPGFLELSGCEDWHEPL
jgi:hypothetical protein